jgi:hypothetical protein
MTQRLESMGRVYALIVAGTFVAALVVGLFGIPL